MMLALEELNAQGGIRVAGGKRRPVEWAVEDSASQNAGAVNALKSPGRTR